MLGCEHSHAIGKWAALSRMSDISVVGVWEPKASIRSEMSRHSEFAGARWFTDFAELSKESIDAVLVETEIVDSLDVAHRAVDCGWHVHLEKPPGRDLSKFCDLQDGARSKQLILQLGYMLRYNPGVRWLIDAVKNGLIGKIFAIHGDMGRQQPWAEREAVRELYPGSMMYVGSHLLDLAVGLLGAPQRSSKFSRNSFPDRDSFTDNELLVLEYDSALVTIRSMLAEVEGGGRRQYCVFGDRGNIEIRPLEPPQIRLSLSDATIGHKKGSQSVELPLAAGRFDAMLGDFISMVRGHPSTVPNYDGAHDRLVQEILLRT